MKNSYKKIQRQIIERLKEFEDFGLNASSKALFGELCFCILTPQSKAKSADLAIRKLKSNKLLYKGKKENLQNYLKIVRFYRNKAKYIIEARQYLNILKNKIDTNNIFETRNWIVSNIKGIGYKEASHFLRNIGLGQNLAILDRHILKNMQKSNIIKEIPKTITKSKYFYLEKKLNEFSKKNKIPMSHLDLLFWYNETGEIFK